jgi:hypothetical protein
LARLSSFLYQIRKLYSSIIVASAVFETNFTIDELVFFTGGSNGRTFSSGRLNGNCNTEAEKWSESVPSPNRHLGCRVPLYLRLFETMNQLARLPRPV